MNTSQATSIIVNSKNLIFRGRFEKKRKLENHSRQCGCGKRISEGRIICSNCMKEQMEEQQSCS